MLRVFCILPFVALVVHANPTKEGQAVTDKDKIKAIWKHINDNDMTTNEVIFCNTPELRTKVKSFVEDCDKAELAAQCGATAPTLLQEVDQCLEDYQQSYKCKRVYEEVIPGCVPLLKKEWELLGQAHAPCKDKMNEKGEIQHVIDNCQTLEGKDEEAKSKCFTDFSEQLYNVDECWTVTNLDLVSKLEAFKHYKDKLAPKIREFESQGYKACVYEPKEYLTKLEAYLTRCDNAKTEEEHYQCRSDAYYVYNFIDEDTQIYGTYCEAFKEYVGSADKKGLDELVKDLQEELATVPKNQDGKLDEERCSAHFYSVADAAVKQCTAEHDPEKRKAHRGEVLEAMWGLMSFCEVQVQPSTSEAVYGDHEGAASGDHEEAASGDHPARLVEHPTVKV